MNDAPHGLIASSLRPGHPDFLDLPWQRPLALWAPDCPRLVERPVGPSRHVVVFVGYEDRVYACKELPPGRAEPEYHLLRQMEELHLPVVVPVGHVRARNPEGETSVLVTRFLDHSLPYHLLFEREDLARYRDHLLDAMANLLVQLHVAGVFWGDCSLYNTLFLRDAGTLQATLVDAETSEIQPQLGPGMRNADLDIMEENVAGGLADLQAAGTLGRDLDLQATTRYVRERYEGLWHEIEREDDLGFGERYRIQDRIRGLNSLGFSVEEVTLRPTADGHRLRLRAVVTDRHYHRDLLHGLTGLEAEEQQARMLMNEIQEHRLYWSKGAGRGDVPSLALSRATAAQRWLQEIHGPAMERLEGLAEDPDAPSPMELYCEVLEHKWYLSERARHDVGHAAALEDYLAERVT